MVGVGRGARRSGRGAALLAAEPARIQPGRPDPGGGAAARGGAGAGQGGGVAGEPVRSLGAGEETGDRPHADHARDRPGMGGGGKNRCSTPMRGCSTRRSTPGPGRGIWRGCSSAIPRRTIRCPTPWRTTTRAGARCCGGRRGRRRPTALYSCGRSPIQACAITSGASRGDTSATPRCFRRGVTRAGRAEKRGSTPRPALGSLRGDACIDPGSDQAVWGRLGVAAGLPGDRVARAVLSAGPLRVRQNHPAAIAGGLLPARRGRDFFWGSSDERGGAAPAQHGHGVSELRVVAAHDRGGECGLRTGNPPGGRRWKKSARGRGAGHGADGGIRPALAHAAFRGAAAAGGSGARAGGAARCAAFGRAIVEPGRPACAWKCARKSGASTPRPGSQQST